jgi:hypothetical protein
MDFSFSFYYSPCDITCSINQGIFEIDVSILLNVTNINVVIRMGTVILHSNICKIISNSVGNPVSRCK